MCGHDVFGSHRLAGIVGCVHIIYCTRYTDGILIVYNNTMTDPDSLTNNMNHVHKDIVFKPTNENKGQIHFLDLLLIQKESNIKTDIYRKPTTTTINFLPNHPIEHKNSSV
jgi:hypothetical protein